MKNTPSNRISEALFKTFELNDGRAIMGFIVAAFSCLRGRSVKHASLRELAGIARTLRIVDGRADVGVVLYVVDKSDQEAREAFVSDLRDSVMKKDVNETIHLCICMLAVQDFLPLSGTKIGLHLKFNRMVTIARRILEAAIEARGSDEADLSN